MVNEMRKAIEAPQNYGFTSVAADAIKNELGKIMSCAETFINFMGGNRSFPVMGNMDDRRHRLFGLQKGDVAFFRQATDFLQSHLNKDGMFHTGPLDKTVRMQLLDQNSGQQAGAQIQGTGPGGMLTFFDLMPDMRDAPMPAPRAGGGTGGSSGANPTQNMGQKAVYQKGQQSFRYMHLTKDESAVGGDNVRHYSNDKNVYYELDKTHMTYLGKRKGGFSIVVTVDGPCVDVYGRIS
jgi:hypothetical protein